MPIIRKKLSPDELNSPTQRYDPDEEQFQVFNGSEWVNDPSIDPRVNPAGQLPPRVTADTRCDAAASMREKVETGINALSTGVGYSVVGTDLLIFLSTVLLGIGLLWSIVIVAAQALIAIGITTLFAALTEAVYDEFQEIIYCLLDDNGQFSESAFTELGVKLNADIGGDAGVGLNIITQLLGRVGMNNAGANGSETGDCSGASCEWYVEFDFTDGSSHGWLAYSDANYVYGGFTGVEFQDNKIDSQRNLAMQLPLSGVTISSRAMYADLQSGTGLGNGQYFGYTSVYPPTSGTWTWLQTGGITDTSGYEWQSSGFTPTVIDHGLFLYLLNDTNGTGYSHIRKIRIGGTGIAPQIGKRVSGLTP